MLLFGVIESKLAQPRNLIGEPRHVHEPSMPELRAYAVPW